MEHIPVLLKESVDFLLAGRRVVGGEGVLVDATFGGGGHSRSLLERSSEGVSVVAIDRDPEATLRGESLTVEFASRFKLLAGNFADLTELLDDAGIDKIDGLLLDIGLSSFQLEEGDRGFSFQSPGPLDMRMDPATGEPASTIVNQADYKTLFKIFRNFGEEPYAAAIARKIVESRVQNPLLTTRSLAALIEDMVPVYKRSRRHPATLVFQALRIVVNDELNALEQVLNAGLERLERGARMVVISYHSLEDRRVKRIFRQATKGCVCPPRVPVCGCGQKPKVKILTGRGVRPQESEIALNPRSRSACLRAVECL
ncbi:MAG: 16S rRNA (cytosine(1402)-N(4))-methyltransferase RsmH [Deltaproteobacteria bacterium]|nr:16S rRNA (cytosine(1402)-N(4))-methyltransferase RsmH [Candidatus Tharpella aukensis]